MTRKSHKSTGIEQPRLSSLKKKNVDNEKETFPTSHWRFYKKKVRKIPGFYKKQCDKILLSHEISQNK